MLETVPDRIGKHSDHLSAKFSPEEGWKKSQSKRIQAGAIHPAATNGERHHTAYPCLKPHDPDQYQAARRKLMPLQIERTANTFITFSFLPCDVDWCARCHLNKQLHHRYSTTLHGGWTQRFVRVSMFHRNDHISLFMPFVDIPMTSAICFQRITSINDRFSFPPPPVL